MKSTKKQYNKIILIVIVILLVIQVISQIRTYDRPLLNIISNLTESAGWRGVFFQQGERLSDYVNFLNENIPTNARVLIPPNGYSKDILSRTSHMQFFLYPREVHNCSVDYSSCIPGMDKSTWYILVLDKNIFSTSDKIIMFDDEYGLSVPESHDPKLVFHPPNINGIKEFILGFVFPILFLTGLLILGAILVHQIFPELPTLFKFSLGFGIGSGLFSLVLFIELMFMQVLSNLLIISAYLIVFLIITLVCKHYRETLPKLSEIIATFKDNRFWLLFIFSLFGVAIIFSVGRGYSVVDELFVWGPKGYGIAAQGLVKGVSNYGTLTTRYTLNIPILIATFRFLFNEALPQSKIIFPFYYLATLIMLYEIIRSRTSNNFSGLMVVLFGSSHIIFNHAIIAYANLPAAFIFCASIYIFNLNIQNSKGLPKNRIFFLSGLLFSLAMWTRPEVIEIGWAIIIFILIYSFRVISPQIHKEGFLFFIAPIIVFTILWYFSIPHVYSEAGFSQGTIGFALEKIVSGNFNLAEGKFLISYFVKSILNFNIWGSIGWLILAQALFLFCIRKQKIQNYPILIGILYTILILGSYYLTSFGKTADLDLSWWLSTGLNRMLLPGIILLWSELSCVFYQESDFHPLI